jgi:hypothetical protein
MDSGSSYGSQSINLSFHGCQTWRTDNDLFTIITEMLRAGDFIPLAKQTVPVGERKRAHPVVHDMRTWFRKKYYFSEVWDAQTFDIFKPKEKFVASFRTTLDPKWRTSDPLYGVVETLFHAYFYGTAYNCITLHILLDIPRPSNQYTGMLQWTEPTFQLFRQVMRAMLPGVQPVYACLADMEPEAPWGHEVLRGDLTGIYWCNYYSYSSPYIKQYGDTLFLTAPGWQVEPFADGVWYQPTEHYTELKAEYQRAQICNHFKGIGVQDITGMAPLGTWWGPSD